MPQFSIEGRLKANKDIQRDFLFEVSFPEISNIITTISDEEPFIVRAKTASIPDRSNTPIESYFMGMTQFYPGRLNLGSVLSIDFEETEDQVITKALYEWQNQIFNIKAEDNDAGHALAESKRSGQTTNIFIKMYKFNGELMENMIRCVNAWPSTIGESPLAMSSNSSVMRSAAFQFDYWDLVKV